MSKFFINRPIVAMVIAILMVIIGLVAATGLPVAQFPNIVPPAIQVNATYTGADALTVEQSVATPIEQQMSGVDNLDYMYSINTNNGMMTLYNYFDLKTDASTDQILSQMREGQAESQLPRDVVDYGVTVVKSTSSPLIMFALYSPKGTYDNVFLANYSYININDQMTRIKGIASVTVFGAGQYAMRLWVRPDQLAKLNITIPEIMNAVKAQKSRYPKARSSPSPSGLREGFRPRSSSVTSCSAPTRTVPSCELVTWRASSWGPRPTTWKVASTGSRAPSSPSTRCRGATPWMPPAVPRS